MITYLGCVICLFQFQGEWQWWWWCYMMRNLKEKRERKGETNPGEIVSYLLFLTFFWRDCLGRKMMNIRCYGCIFLFSLSLSHHFRSFYDLCVFIIYPSKFPNILLSQIFDLIIYWFAWINFIGINLICNYSRFGILQFWIEYICFNLVLCDESDTYFSELYVKDFLSFTCLVNLDICWMFLDMDCFGFGYFWLFSDMDNPFCELERIFFVRFAIGLSFGLMIQLYEAVLIGHEADSCQKSLMMSRYYYYF